jgi:hypothetical protein
MSDLTFYTGTDEWEVVTSEGRFAVCKFTNERMRITASGDVLTGSSLRTPEFALETHWFQTREWAQMFRDHCVRLDRIASDMRTPITFTCSNGAYIMHTQPQSDWTCYLFGNKPGGAGIVYSPTKDKVPNVFVRWMMKLCLGCTWVKGGA